MTERLAVSVRSLVSVVSWVYRRAQSIGASLVGAQYQVRSAIIDGYIIRARRSGRRVSVVLMDTPALLALPGPLINNGSSDLPHTAVAVMPAGRDALMVASPITAQAHYPEHLGVSQRFMPVGVIPQAWQLVMSRVRRSLSAFQGFGAVDALVTLHMQAATPANPYAFMSRTDRVVYNLARLAPSMGLVKFRAEAAGWSAVDIERFAAPVSLSISDSVMEPFGLLPFSKRVAPPAYDPGDPLQTTYANAQNPWVRVASIAAGSVDGVTYHRLMLCVHVVCDMVSDLDRFAARGLWFAQVLVVEGFADKEQAIAAVDAVIGSAGPGTAVADQPGATVILERQSVVDMRASGDPRSTPGLTASGIYATNNIQPAMLCRLESGVAVAFAVSNCYQKGYAADQQLYENFNTVTCHRISVTGSLSSSRAAGPSKSNMDLNLPMSPNDMAYPCGADTDGLAAYAIFFSSDSIRQLGAQPTATPTLNVIRADEAGQAVVLSITTPFRICYFAAAQTECVRYIGNHKFLFLASEAYTYASATGRGDLCAMIYDASSNQVYKAGVIDPQVRAPGTLLVGSMDCPVVEKEVDGAIQRQATVIVTTGSSGQRDGEAGGEAGKTYISYDSGNTWSVLALYGSGSGVRYCGTMLKTRTAEL